MDTDFAIKKKSLGQFFTTNSNYILQGLGGFVAGKRVVDPFAGNCELLNWVEGNGAKSATGFDCDQDYVDGKKVFYNDSINAPRNYEFVCTNPPYLHKNKASREIKQKFFSGENAIFEDLYQVSIKSILNCHEGIIIVPLNFLCAQNSQKARDLFFEKFQIVKLNIFSRQVFDDTTYNVIAFYFTRNQGLSKNIVDAVIYPENKKIKLTFEKKFGWQFGGEFIGRIKETKNKLGISRLTENDIDAGDCEVPMALENIKNKKVFKTNHDIKNLLDKNILFLRAIDSKNGKKIQLEDIRKYNIAGLVGKSTSRNMAHLLFQKDVSVEEQLDLMEFFNESLQLNREKYFSFFLTNFRDNNRKRMSFDLAYRLLNLIYSQKYENQSSLF